MNSKILLAASIAAACAPRRIITRGVLDWDGNVLEEDSHLYSGPMALADDAGDLAAITKTIADIGTLAKASGAKVEGEITKLTEVTKSMGARVLDLEQKLAAANDPAAILARMRGGGGEVINIGKSIVEDDKFKALRSGNAQLVNIEVKQSLRAICKSVLTNTDQGADSPQVNFPSPTQFLAPTPQQAPGRRLLVLQALNHLPVNAASITVPKVTSTTDGSGVQQGEGASKSESVISVTGDLLSLPAIATYLNLSKQVWADVAALPTFLQSWLSFFVLRKLESLIISGDGGDTDKILGLTHAGTQYIPTEDHAVDRIAEACAIGLPAYGYSPTLIVLSCVDAMRIWTQRDSQGRYLNANGWTAGFNTTLWGTPAVASPGCPTGTAIVLDSALVQILDREEVNMQVGYVGSQFQNNEFSLRCEGRWNCSVMDPHAIMVVTLPADSPNF